MLTEITHDNVNTYLNQISNYYTVTGIDCLLNPDDFELTKASLSNYQSADPGQSFLGVINLNKNANGKYEIHLIASSNQGNGSPVADKDGKLQVY